MISTAIFSTAATTSSVYVRNYSDKDMKDNCYDLFDVNHHMDKNTKDYEFNTHMVCQYGGDPIFWGGCGTGGGSR
jgi:hypothetical protein